MLFSDHCFSAAKRLISLTKVHIESFNYASTQGLNLILDFINRQFLLYNYEKHIKLTVLTGLYISKPYYLQNKRKLKLIPRCCREMKITYKSDLISIFVNNFRFNFKKLVMKIGEIPIMVKSLKCNLNNLKAHQLIEVDEEELETGGYFIVNGIEKIIRLLIVPRKNIIQIISRLSNAERSNLCTTLSCSIRSVDKIQNSKTLHLHYLTTGSIYVRIIVKRQEFFFPIVIIIKALVDISDKQLINILTNYNPKDKFLRQRVMNMIKHAHNLCDVSCRNNTLNFLGKIIRIGMDLNISENSKIAEIFLSENLLIHLGCDNHSKLNLLLFMVQKLFSVKRGLSQEDNPDSLDSQEFLLPGHLYFIYIKEKMENMIFTNFEKFISKKKTNCNLNFSNAVLNSISLNIEKFISSGNIYSSFKGELSQLTGLTISVERQNFGRFISYFRSVHRGKFISEIKTTSSRKLLPQMWGFMCPVHTPDGAPCGILNHISSSVVISLNHPIDKIIFHRYLCRNGLINNSVNKKFLFDYIVLDGKILGFMKGTLLRCLIDKLRCEKVSKVGIIPLNTEIIYISSINTKSFFYGCYIFSEESRLMRPVFWNKFNREMDCYFLKKRNKNFNFKNKKQLEIVGTFEQSFLNINSTETTQAIKLRTNYWSHSEIDVANILSIIATLTPFSDLNQSPRNMYQCQMSKQSVGIPFYTFWRRDDVKSYFLLSPQVSISRSRNIQDGLILDSFPNGTNAIVAILSYTGFDMEDAMIINKSSIERGFLLSDVTTISSFEMKNLSKGKGKKKSELHGYFYQDNLPEEQIHIARGSPIVYNTINNKSGKKQENSICYNGHEKVVIKKVKLINKEIYKKDYVKSLVKFSSRRRPVTGDKFASRHGQKGVLSIDYPLSDLPFSENGTIPDIIFNPHGFPSRMTIGLILESLAGKTGSLNGVFCDSSPFRFAKKYLSVYKFGEKLRELGFMFYGDEMFYSGYTGEPFRIEIYTGVVQYQRLRHMVNDKFQVSEIGPRNIMTRQPIKGRKTGGAIRFGEMERDALLGHGSVFLLHDRLQLASDLHSVKINFETGSLVCKKQDNKSTNFLNSKLYTHKTLFLPYVTKFLINELSVMNIKAILHTKEI